MNWRAICAAGFACITVLGVATGAAAEPREHRGDGWHGDIRAFHERDIQRWRGGRWYRGAYRGHFGWWWIVGGVYYWYPRPVYPYPDPLVPPVYVEQPPVVTEHSMPQQVPPPPSAPGQPPQSLPQAAAGTWYYCDSAKSYYPYVADCPGGWRAVPATPNAPQR